MLFIFYFINSIIFGYSENFVFLSNIKVYFWGNLVFFVLNLMRVIWENVNVGFINIEY